MAEDPKSPQSPDQLGGSLRGKVSGVTRIGGRAFAIGAGVAALLMFLIFYGVTKKNTPPAAGPGSGPTLAPIAQQTENGDFGATVPIVPTAGPSAEPTYSLVTPSPDLTAAPVRPAPVAAAVPFVPRISQADLAAQAAENARRQKDEADRLAAAKKRADDLELAKRSRILTGQGQQAGAGGGAVDATSGAQQLSFAGNGSETSGAAGPASGGGAYGGNGAPGTNGGAQPGTGIGAGSGDGTFGAAPNGGGANALLGRPNPPASAPAATEASTGFLTGPLNQYGRVGAANINLPAGGTPGDFLQAQRFAPISPFEITASSVIPAALITGIDSELQGLISAQIREDVYDSKTGKYLLIPKGARLVGLYRSATGYGSSRLLVAWQRLIFPDTSSIDLLNMSGADVEGGAGFGGDVDNHYGKIFGAALLTSVLAAGASLASPQQQSIGIGGNVSPGTLVSQEVSQNILNIGTNITNKALNIPPDVHVKKGYPFLVVVDRDIVLPGPYGNGL